MIDQLIDMMKDTLDQSARRVRILQRNAVCDGIEVAEGRFGTDYFSHRPMRRFASACGTVRPSSIARSP